MISIVPLLAGAVFSSFAPAEAPITVRVLVLDYDPIVKSEGGKRLHEVFHWRDPKELAAGYAADVEQASGGFIKFKIVDWRSLDVYPTKTDGFQYDEAAFLAAWRAKKGFHDPDGSDYEKIVADQKIVPLVDSGKVDEVWMFGAPYFGFWESAMAGPGAFEINGGVYDKVPSKKPFAIMGFNYERGLAEMIHDLCHRTEATMSRVYGGWKADKLDTPWARFAANVAQSNGVAAVGTCHYPPNAENDYDYANPRTVQSSADDWLNYPHLTGATKPVNKDTWGGPDYQRNYLKWWFTRLPKARGTSPDGRQNNWWKYVFRFTAYDEHGLAPRK